MKAVARYTVCLAKKESIGKPRKIISIGDVSLNKIRREAKTTLRKTGVKLTEVPHLARAPP